MKIHSDLQQADNSDGDDEDIGNESNLVQKPSDDNPDYSENKEESNLEDASLETGRKTQIDKANLELLSKCYGLEFESAP